MCKKKSGEQVKKEPRKGDDYHLTSGHDDILAMPSCNVGKTWHKRFLTDKIFIGVLKGGLIASLTAQGKDTGHPMEHLKR